MSQHKDIKHTSYGVMPLFLNNNDIKEYLLMQGSGGYWGFPKGHTEDNETPKVSAISEALYEADLDIDAAELSYYDSYATNSLSRVRYKQSKLYYSQYAFIRKTLHSKPVKLNPISG